MSVGFLLKIASLSRSTGLKVILIDYQYLGFGHFSKFSLVDLINIAEKYSLSENCSGPHLSLSFRIPLRTYALLALLTVGTMGLSNTSLGYLNYPTQVTYLINVVRFLKGRC